MLEFLILLEDRHILREPYKAAIIVRDLTEITKFYLLGQQLPIVPRQGHLGGCEGRQRRSRSALPTG